MLAFGDVFALPRIFHDTALVHPLGWAESRNQRMLPDSVTMRYSQVWGDCKQPLQMSLEERLIWGYRGYGHLSGCNHCGGKTADVLEGLREPGNCEVPSCATLMDTQRSEATRESGRTPFALAKSCSALYLSGNVADNPVKPGTCSAALIALTVRLAVNAGV